MSFTTPILGLQVIPAVLCTTTSNDQTGTYLIGSITLAPIAQTREVVSLDARVATWSPLQSQVGSLPHTLWGVLSWDKEESYRESGYFDIVVSVESDITISSMVNALGDRALWLGSSTAEKKWNSFVVAGLVLEDVPGYNKTHHTMVPYGERRKSSGLQSITFYVIHVGATTEVPIYKLTIPVSTD